MLLGPILVFALPTCDDVKSTYSTWCCGHNDLSNRSAACPANCMASHTLSRSFSYQDTTDYTEMSAKFTPLLESIKAKTARATVYVEADDTTAELRAQTVQIAAISTGKVPKAIACAHFEPLAIMTDSAGSFGYTSIIVARRDSGITSLNQIAGATVGMTKPSSNSGYMIPTSYLKNDYGLVVDVDYSVSELTYHPAVLTALKNGDISVGALASNIPNQVINGVYASYGHTMTEAEWNLDFEILWESEPFPTTAFGVHSSLPSDVKTQIQNGFIATVFNGTTMGESYGHDQKFSVATSSVWDPVSAVQADLMPFNCSEL